MLRRSLFLFGLFVLLGLGLTAAYALLNLRGPIDVLDEARESLQRGELVRVVDQLDRCEGGAGMRDLELRRQLWRLRLEANLRLKNHQRALQDVENLLGADDPDPKLQLQRVYLLAALGQGAAAKQRALEFLRTHPNSARGLELAGEACQVEYRESLQKLSETLRADLEYALHERARTAMLAYLYRPAGDNGGTTALLQLRELYEREPQRHQTWIRLQDSLKDLRERIQQALENYQHALELATKGQVDKALFFAAAYRGVSFALQQGGRLDDVVAQAEIYRAQFDNQFTVEAAINAAQAHLEDGQWRACVETADRFLPPGTFRARLAQNRITAETLLPLYEAKALALYHLRDQAGLDRCENELRDMGQAGLQMQRAIVIAAACNHIVHERNPQAAEQTLAVAYHLSLNEPVPTSGPDIFAIVTPMRIELMQQLGAKVADMLEVVDRWRDRRPASLEPARARARVLLGANQAPAAMSTAESILQKNPRDDDALHVLAAAAAIAYAASGQDGKGLLLQCLSRRVGRPDVPHPICHLLCGEEALAQGHLGIARDCGRAAADRFPQARWPKLLQARALLAGGGYAEAASVLERAIADDPDDREALQLWFESCRKQDLPLTEHLADVVRSGVTDPAVRTALLRSALEGDSTAAWYLARTVASQPENDSKADAEQLALAAQALAPSQPADARRLLDRARKLLGDRADAHTQAALLDATLAWLEQQAKKTADAELAPRVVAELTQLRLLPAAANPLLDAAVRLEALDLPRSAYELAATALQLREAAEQRNGVSFLLAARLQLRLGNLERATDHLTAAVSFPDGADAAEPLARLLILQARGDRAAEAFALASPPVDAALALRCGQRELAFALAQKAIVADPGDLLAQLVFALSTQVAPDALGAELKAAPPAVRAAATEVAALLGDRLLAARAEPSATELLTKLPTSPTLQLLAARAMLAAGKQAAAAAVHADLFAKGLRAPALFAEAARGTLDLAYPMPAAIRAELRTLATTTPDSLPPRLLVFAMQDVAAEAALAGHPEVSARIFSDLWLKQPAASGATIANAQVLLAQKRLRDALVLLDALRREGPPNQRSDAATTMFAVATEHGTPDAGLEAAMVTAARAQMLTAGPYGPALRFLAAEPRRLQGVPDADLRSWLETVITGAGSGAENMPVAVELLALLEQRFGRDAALTVLDRALHEHPELLHFWVARARLLAQLRRATEGIDDARAALVHGEAPMLELELLAIAGEERCLTSADFARATALPKELLATPLGKYVRGLLALREGRFDDAEPLLAAAPPRQNGFPLYARALANLPRKTPEARKAAADLFAKFAKDYPSSASARSAGSFARQLGSN